MIYDDSNESERTRNDGQFSQTVDGIFVTCYGEISSCTLEVGRLGGGVKRMFD